MHRQKCLCSVSDLLGRDSVEPANQRWPAWQAVALPTELVALFFRDSFLASCCQIKGEAAVVGDVHGFRVIPTPKGIGGSEWPNSLTFSRVSHGRLPIDFRVRNFRRVFRRDRPRAGCGGSLLGFVLREMSHTDATCGRRGFKLWGQRTTLCWARSWLRRKQALGQLRALALRRGCCRFFFFFTSRTISIAPTSRTRR